METFSTLLAIFAGNSSVTGEFSRKGQCRVAMMFSFISAWINGWVNNHEAGNSRRHRANYDGIAMAHLLRVALAVQATSSTPEPSSQIWHSHSDTAPLPSKTASHLEFKAPSILYFKTSTILKHKSFSSRLAVVFVQFIEATCEVGNEDVVGAAPPGDAPTTSGWWTIFLPTKVRLKFETLR